MHKLVLGRRHFVVVFLNGQAHFGENGEHFGAHVLATVDRRDREVAALGARTVAHVAGFVVGVVIGRQFRGIELEAGVVRIGLVLDVVEDEEFGFGADIDGVAEAGCLEIGFSLLGRGARIAAVGFAGDRVENVAEDCHGRLGEERIHVGRRCVGHQDHVGFVDGLPAGNRGAVKHHAIGEKVFIDAGHVHGHVLHLALRVGEAQIDKLDVVVLDLLEDFCGSRHVRYSLFVNDDGCAAARRTQWSDGVVAGFTGPDADNFLDVGNEDLAITDAAGLGCIANGIYRCFRRFVRENDFDLHLRQKVNDVLCPAIEFGVALLATETLGLGDSDALQADFLKSFLHFIKLEGLDDRFDLFHENQFSALSCESGQLD
jgi:hypothetical protein